MDQETFIANMQMLGFMGPVRVYTHTTGVDCDMYILKIKGYSCIVYIRTDAQFDGAYVTWIPFTWMTQPRLYADTKHPPVLSWTEALSVILSGVQDDG